MMEAKLHARIRPADESERDVSCNGCHVPFTYVVLELASVTAYGAGTTQVWRMCSKCLLAFREAVLPSEEVPNEALQVALR